MTFSPYVKRTVIIPAPNLAKAAIALFIPAMAYVLSDHTIKVGKCILRLNERDTIFKSVFLVLLRVPLKGDLVNFLA
jgi:hypothetical protein